MIKHDFSGAIFDMDGTLIDSMWIWEEMASKGFRDMGIDIPDDLGHRIFAMTFLEAAEYCINLTGINMSPAELVDDWEATALAYYDDILPLKPFVREYIYTLKEEGIKLSLTTSNFYDVAIEVLEKHDLTSYFDSVTSTREVTRSKMYPDVFLLSAQRLELAPQNCIVFEDSYTSMMGAKAAGMYVVGVYDDYSANRYEDIKKVSDLYIRSYEELL